METENPFIFGVKSSGVFFIRLPFDETPQFAPVLIGITIPSPTPTPFHPVVNNPCLGRSAPISSKRATPGAGDKYHKQQCNGKDSLQE